MKKNIFKKALSLIVVFSLFALTLPVQADETTPMPVPEIEGLVIASDPLEVSEPIITILPYTTTPVQSLTVTAQSNAKFISSAPYTYDPDTGVYTSSYTFTENGMYTFEVMNNMGTAAHELVTITNIDTVAPMLDIQLSETSPTNQNVIATASTNEGTLNATSHTFTENGTFTFTATDEAGNTSSFTVEVGNIDKTAPVITIAPYITTNTTGPITVTATANEEGTLNATSHTFTQNGSFTFTATDEAGNTASQTVTITNITSGNTGGGSSGSSSGGTIDVCVNIPGNQIVIPVGYTIDGNRNCTLPTVEAATTGSVDTQGQVLGASKFVFKDYLFYGDQKSDVKELQDRLFELGFMKRHLSTGFFGDITIAAVRAFQRAHEIPPTGNVAVLTVAALNQ